MALHILGEYRAHSVPANESGKPSMPTMIIPQAIKNNKTSQVIMPKPWRHQYTAYGNIETWINPRDGSEVMINTSLREAIWIIVGEETHRLWPHLDSPMSYPGSDSPIGCIETELAA